MKQVILLTFIASVLFISCSTKQETESKNLLLNDKVEALYFTDTIFFQTKVNYSFFKSLTEAVLSGKVKGYDFPIATYDFSNIPEINNLEGIKNHFKLSSDTLFITDSKTKKITQRVFLLDHIKDTRNIFFVEEWKIDKDLKFIKDVKYYAPVQYYCNAFSPDKPMTTVSFVVKNEDVSKKDKKNFIPIASHISYTVNFDPDSLKRPIINGLNKNNLRSFLVDSVLKGKFKVYDFTFDKFDMSSDIISAEAIKKGLGERIETIDQKDIDGNSIGTKIDTVKAIDHKNEIVGVLFVENWYYDLETFSFFKEVVGIGPVREYADPDVSGQYRKSIPFIISMQ